MPSPLLQLRIPQDLADWLEAKYPSRGEVAEYVRQLLTAEQMKEAVAPLVPDSWVPNGSESPSTEAFGYGFREVKAEPKPKARRKKSVKIPDQPASVMNRGGATVPTQEPSPASVPLAIRAAIREFPSRCNRGACTGTINPVSGRCLRCNQTPVKESK